MADGGWKNAADKMRMTMQVKKMRMITKCGNHITDDKIREREKYLTVFYVGRRQNSIMLI